MYLRELWEKEQQEASLMDVSETELTRKSVLALHHEQELYARWCAMRVFERMCRMVGKYQGVDSQGAGTRMKVTLMDIVELAFEHNWLEDQFEKYSVEVNHIDLACSLVREMLKTQLQVALQAKKRQG